MEKLIELLNEYRPNSWMEYMGGIAYIGADQYSYPVDCEVLTIISKEYGFIKRLVDNDKITSYGIKPRDKLVKEIIILDQDGNAIGWDNKYTEEEQLLMYLSIQDNPIEFLISILK